jgi:DNA-binding LacI/PurR family transcriptional regulator
MQIHKHDWRVDLLRESGCPFVMIGHCDDNTGLSFIDLDFEAAAIVAFEYLVGQEHRRIAFLGQSEVLRQQGYAPAARSWRGCQQIVQRYHIPSIYREANFVAQDVFDATLELLDTLPSVTAIVTTYGSLALSTLQALIKRGLRVPDDCSVIGVTTEQIAALSTPAMPTSIFHRMKWVTGLSKCSIESLRVSSPHRSKC